MPYTYDYTNAVTGNENAPARYWRAMKMALTRCVRMKTFHFDGETVIGWEEYGYGYNHSYCLVFSKSS